MNTPKETLIETMQENIDKQLEKEHLTEFKHRAENFTDREKKIVLKTISNKMLVEELNRRLVELTKIVNDVRKSVKY